MKIISNKIKESARGEQCNLNIAGICNYNNNTTILAHLPSEESGMGTKSSDLSACYACSDCHDVIDGRNMKEMSKLIDSGELEWYMRRAQTRFIHRLFAKEILTVRGAKIKSKTFC